MNQTIELNDLFDYGYKIYQNPLYFKFSVDSVLLAEFIKIKKNDNKIIDLCTGNAPIPMILSKKYGNKLEITGVELQKEIYDLGIKSINYNKITNIKLINDDINNLSFINKYDIVSCNPPYFKNNIIQNENKIKAIARHEIKIDLKSIIRISSKLLNNGGYFYLVHRPERLTDIIILLDKYHFGIKRIVPIYTYKDNKCVFILIESIYNGKNYVKIDKPVFLKHDDKTYQGIFEGKN